MKQVVTIERRYRGPVSSGNGGYSCGLIAGSLSREGGPPISAKLTAPPPLDCSLELEVGDHEAVLAYAGQNIGTASVASLDMDVPPCPTMEMAEKASERFMAYNDHLVPECFVCGTGRKTPDALCLHPGAIDQEETSPVATSWIPHTDFADDRGIIKTEIIWAALDCPSYFGLDQKRLIALLGSMTTQIYTLPKAMEPCIVLGWKVAVEGRKYFAGSALYQEDGTLLGKAKCLWIELKKSDITAKMQ